MGLLWQQEKQQASGKSKAMRFLFLRIHITAYKYTVKK